MMCFIFEMLILKAGIGEQPFLNDQNVETICSTLLGSMSPLITVLLAVVFQQKRFSKKTWLSMPVICMGLAMCSVKVG